MRARVEEPVRLRVATYNIRKSVGLDWRRRPERILEVLREIKADVVALQEVDKRLGSRQTTLSREALAEAGWRTAGVSRRPLSIGWHGNTILLGPETALREARAMELPALEPRGAAWAELTVRGRDVRVIGLHLGLTGGQRLKQVAAILSALERAPPEPTVLMGDTNEWRPDAGCLALLAETCRLAPPRPTFHASRPVAPLDRIAVSADITIREVHAHRSEAARRASDHLPLWADLELAA